MKHAFVWLILAVGGCSEPHLTWDGVVPPQVAVGATAKATIKADTTGELQWRVVPETDWLKLQIERDSAHVVASPPRSSVGNYSFSIQARQGHGGWSEPLKWSLDVTPRTLPPLEITLGDDNCAFGEGDGLTDQRFVGGGHGGGTRIFSVDLGQTRSMENIVKVDVWVDTGDLNRSESECRDGFAAFCEDLFRVDGTATQWSPDVSFTKCGTQDLGETKRFMGDRVADRKVLERVASNSLRLVVAPSTGDDCLVNRVVVVLWLVER